jgi:hypothetical protein
MTDDISDVLNRWPFDARRSVRRVVGLDGNPKLQVRLPLGIEQYELDGRPDGKRPHGSESLLDYHERRLEEYRAARGSDEGFVLSSDACKGLQEEGLLYYFRYLLCYQIGEYEVVKRDAERNMRLFRFVGRYAENDEDRKESERYWPYIIRMQAMACALEALEEGDPPTALGLLREASQKITELKEVDTPIFFHERERSLTLLGDTIRGIEKDRPVSEKEQLMKRLKRAVENENYEQAARLRDIISRMREEREGSKDDG